MSTQKTKLQIIEETVAYYSEDVTRRSVGLLQIGNTRSVSCLYRGPDGKRCAFSRCCKEDTIELLKEGGGVLFQKLNCDDYLKEEYQGHSVVFWKAVQSLHDNNKNWSDRGLSEMGKEHLKNIKSQYE